MTEIQSERSRARDTEPTPATPDSPDLPAEIELTPVTSGRTADAPIPPQTAAPAENPWANIASAAWDKESAATTMNGLRDLEKDSKQLAQELDQKGNKNGYLGRDELNELLIPRIFIREPEARQKALAFLDNNFDSIASATADGGRGISQNDINKYWNGFNREYDSNDGQLKTPTENPERSLQAIKDLEEDSKAFYSAVALESGYPILTESEIDKALESKNLVNESKQRQETLVFLKENFAAIANSVNDQDGATKSITEADLERYWNGFRGNYSGNEAASLMHKMEAALPELTPAQHQRLDDLLNGKIEKR